ncbi:aminodeoxychorismate synthase component I [Alkalibacillus aidingensis]|uniref:aminodeoxychorismate synthase component I n=1 Tax=Alkalibacillus aidingensis TaxID=2747607 RepID=UPI0016611BF2|nr:aminodeoxychorismate synthase component I [Alkalibacillus aidingensis]
MSEVSLSFRFNHPYLEQDRMDFKDPVEILTATDITEVKKVINQAELYAKKGYYVAGYVSYEAAQAFLPNLSYHEPKELPLIWFGVFNQPVEASSEPVEEVFIQANWQADTTRFQYNQTITNIRGLIERGITYQVNYTLRLIAELDSVHIDAWFEQLCRAQQANYAALLKIGSHDILSVSPELFFAWDGCVIETRPMKGTMKRGLTFEEDERLKHQLAKSEKDRAENVMIVDLLRNDVARIAKAGSVHVPNLFTIETYQTVHQMTSSVKAETGNAIRLVDLFDSLFPCGSITGAPKQSTMQQIYQLENSPREVYCGAIGLLTPEGKAVFNVPIRTVMVNRQTNQAIYGVGGGITWDSSAEGEYEETINKAKVLQQNPKSFQLIETMLLENGIIKLEEEHQKRISRSAKYFDYPFSLEYFHQTMTAIKQNQVGRYRVRLQLTNSGEFSFELFELGPPTESKQKVALANKPINKNDVFLYHKTTNRDLYYHLKRTDVEVYDTLLWNQQDNLTEFTTGNLVYQLHGEWFTPPINDGLLPGTYRQKLIETGEIQVRSLAKSELSHVDKLVFINSVRGWIDVSLKNDLAI